MKRIFNGLNVAYVFILSVFIMGYFKAKSTYDVFIAEAIARGSDSYYYLSYGRKGLLYILLSFIALTTIFFMKQFEESN